MGPVISWPGGRKRVSTTAARSSSEGDVRVASCSGTNGGRRRVKTFPFGGADVGPVQARAKNEAKSVPVMNTATSDAERILILYACSGRCRGVGWGQWLCGVSFVGWRGHACYEVRRERWAMSCCRPPMHTTSARPPSTDLKRGAREPLPMAAGAAERATLGQARELVDLAVGAARSKLVTPSPGNRPSLLNGL